MSSFLILPGMVHSWEHLLTPRYMDSVVRDLELRHNSMGKMVCPLFSCKGKIVDHVLVDLASHFRTLSPVLPRHQICSECCNLCNLFFAVNACNKKIV